MAKKSKPEKPKAKPAWYIVTCRIAHDDEDALYVVLADNEQAAIDEAENRIREESDAPKPVAGEDVEVADFFIMYVVACGIHEPRVLRSP